MPKAIAGSKRDKSRVKGENCHWLTWLARTRRAVLAVGADEGIRWVGVGCHQMNGCCIVCCTAT